MSGQSANSFVYGIHAVDALLRQRAAGVQCIAIDNQRQDKRIAALVELAKNQGVAVERSTKQSLDEKVTGRHQGVVAQLREGASSAGDNLWSESQLLQHLEALQAQTAAPRLLLVLDGVTDPHNLGACLRSADAAGVDAVIVPKDKSADLTPVVSKVACGAAETVPFVKVTNLSRTLQALQQIGFWVFGTDGEAEKTIYNSDISSSVALVMGAEGKGLRRLTKENCDHLIRLPMAGSVSSLNVSVAAGICLFEAVRQRSGS
ncbi:MAG: 23S rRNA (guanosine(2251)-2'-O)-methyltransferase RlmB [Halioglobus sp.]